MFACALWVLAARPSDARAADAVAVPPPAYPQAKQAAIVDEYHSVRVADPYRWLEEAGSPESREWLAAQRDVTRRYFASLPGRDVLRGRLAALWDFPRCGLPETGGRTLFFQRVDGQRNQPVLYAWDGAEAAPRPLVDPNQLDPSGATSTCGWSVSPDGRWLAYALMVAGSDQHVWRIRDVAANQDLPETLATTLYNEIVWSPRSDGFYYARSNIPPPPAAGEPRPPERVLRIKFHRVGEEPERDRVLYERGTARDAMCDVRLSHDGRWLVSRLWRGLERDRRVFYIDLHEARPTPRWIVGASKAYFQFIGVDQDRFLLQTDQDAPRGRVIAIDRRRTASEHWRTIVPEGDDTLVETTLVDRQLVVRGLRDAASVVRRFALDGRPLADLPLPGAGTVTGLHWRTGDAATYFSYTSYASPPRIYRWRPVDDSVEEFQPAPLSFDPEKYRTELVHFLGGDGVRIPMRITRRLDRPARSDSPLLLYGYGGFHIPATPTFSLTHLAWLDLGGVLAVPNVRGGGEFGRPWHDAGRGANKGVAVDDFLAAAKWLVAQRHTSPERLAIRGVSNGGMIVGAAMAREPQLFAAAIPAVAPLDMVRYHRLPRGWAWIGEYGTADDPDQFRAILRYSPLHNLRERTKYPATLIMTSEQDDRVTPTHSYKFTAALQAAQAGSAPCLLRIEENAGHGAGISTPKLIDAGADMLAFLCHVLRVDTQLEP